MKFRFARAPCVRCSPQSLVAVAAFVARRVRRDQGRAVGVVGQQQRRRRRSSGSDEPNPDAPIKPGLKTVSIPKQLGNPYEEFEHSGIDEALKELGGSNRITGPTDAGGVVADPDHQRRRPAEARRDHHRRQRPQRRRARAQAGRAARHQGRRHGLRRGARRAQRLRQPGHDRSSSARTRSSRSPSRSATRATSRSSRRRPTRPTRTPGSRS